MTGMVSQSAGTVYETECVVEGFGNACTRQGLVHVSQMNDHTGVILPRNQCITVAQGSAARYGVMPSAAGRLAR